MGSSKASRLELDSEIPIAPVSGIRLRVAPRLPSRKQRSRHGHDHHFLSRLSRVSHAEMELALSLYRNASLVKAILASPLFPKRESRVAVSLDDPQKGPFVIIARNGHFVTCLGRGMWPGRRPIISRAELVALSANLRAEPMRF